MSFVRTMCAKVVMPENLISLFQPVRYAHISPYAHAVCSVLSHFSCRPRVDFLVLYFTSKIDQKGTFQFSGDSSELLNTCSDRGSTLEQVFLEASICLTHHLWWAARRSFVLIGSQLTVQPLSSAGAALRRSIPGHYLSHNIYHYFSPDSDCCNSKLHVTQQILYTLSSFIASFCS